MFTGLTLGFGEIIKRRPLNNEYELTVQPEFEWNDQLAIGESIAVSGVCLTVTALAGRNSFTAFASAETTSLSNLRLAKKVNLERALAVGDRLGGHMVSGHIDGQGETAGVEKADNSLIYSFKVPPDLAPFIVPKGSITIDGVSLTVNKVEGAMFTVNLIPHTAKTTTLGFLKPGEPVNLETDIIGKYVHSFLTAPETSRASQGLSLEFLAKHGFGR